MRTQRLPRLQRRLPASATRTHARARLGVGLVEVVIALPIVALSLSMFVQMLTAGTALRGNGREDWIASAAAQNVLEEIRNRPLSQVFADYNADPFDDPGGPGTSFGARFPVEGLQPRPDAEDGMVGEVVLPTVNTGTPVVPTWEVREDTDDPVLGLPRDLNGDSIIDDINHSDDYSVLPVLIRLRWQGPYGPRTLTIATVFAEMR